jgi:Na+-transporting NADH:ubiquinone oxidoreductase subunit A
MNKARTGLVLFALCLFSTVPLLAQAPSASAGNTLLYGMLAAAVVLLLMAIMRVSDNMLIMESRRLGVEKEGVNYGVMPDSDELFPADKPQFVGKASVKSLKKGHDIMLEGQPGGKVQSASVQTFALQAPDFQGISPLPKLEVEVGSSVLAGDPLFFDKAQPQVKFAAPISGEVIAINRGDKRAITEVVILADKTQKSREIKNLPALDKANRSAIIEFLCEYGAMPLIRQRPYNMVADPAVVPANIFISTFDTAPLAPDLNLVVEGRGAAFQAGLNVLSCLTDGHVYLGLNAAEQPSSVFLQATGVEKVWFKGKHPAGNVGVQIHHIQPIRGSQKVWTLGVQEVITIGTLFSEKKYDTERVVAIGGSEVSKPGYVRTHLGASLSDLLKGQIGEDSSKLRIISGDVLSGKAKNATQFLGTFDDQLTVIPEGDDYDMFGWLLPSKAIPSASKTYLTTLFKDLRFAADTNTRGEKRAFVVTGQYENLLPMDIYPQHLMKSIIIGDVERMQGLGIHELVEEDVALCEFACTSKQPLQKILRDGIQLMQKEGL